MNWNPQGGGPWGGGSGGGGGGGPWGGGPGGSGGPRPPDLEEILRKGQARFKGWLPSGGGSARNILIIIALVVVGWGLTGFFRVQPGEVGVTLLFGEYKDRKGPGLAYWPPAPIGDVIKVNVERTNTIPVGFRGQAELAGRRGGAVDVPQESLMLSGDQNIVDIDFVVQWRIKDAANYLFNIRNPEVTIKLAAESAIREVIGQTNLEEALTTGRQQVEQQTKDLLQDILDAYSAGVIIAEVKQQAVDPPQPVIDAFQDVQRARQDQERSINEAVAYRNDIVPRAKGQAQRMIQDANAYKERLINEAEGEAKRFLSVYNAYKVNKDITKRRLYLERMREILSRTDKIIIDKGASGSGVVPYLPLPEVQKRRGGAQQ